MDAADGKDQLNQLVIKAKEGATEAITDNTVGANMIDTILRTSVDEHELYQLINSAIQGAYHPRISDVRAQYTDIIAMRFNSHQRVSDNVTVL